MWLTAKPLAEHSTNMNEIEAYFSQFTWTPEPENGSPPCEVVWKHAGLLQLRGQRFYVGDSWNIGVDCVDVPATPGEYEATVECFSYGTDGRIARLRLLLNGAAPTRSVIVGEFGVDVASAGVIDADALDAWADREPDDYESWMDEFTTSRLENYEMVGFFPCEEADTQMLHCSTGFGDGSYTVLSLLEGEKPVGFEAVFLKPGHGYFEN